MSDHSPRLDLPYVQPSQAQKHVTVNEAFERIDALAQLVVQEFGALTPPPVATPGIIWALGAAPTGVWENQGGHLAIATQGGGWMFILPEQGWRAWGVTEAELRVYTGGAWGSSAADKVSELGIGADANTTNRLAVSSPASLFSHAGNGHYMKINKAGVGDTASVLMQTNWTGHAEIGLAGTNELSIKVSPDGSAWNTALQFDSASGAATGAAVQFHALDTTAGRLMPVGAFGLGQSAALPNGNVDQAVATGFYGGFGGAHASPSAGANPFATLNAPMAVQTIQTGSNAGDWAQLAVATAGTAPSLRMRQRLAAGTLSDWVDVVTSATAVGPVADGGLIETGTTANGTFVKYADGTLICTLKRLELVYRSVADCHAAWVFPSAFVDAQALSVSASLITPTDAADPFSVASAATPLNDEIGAPIAGALTAIGVQIAVPRIKGGANFQAGDKLYVSAKAIGRWK